MACGCTTPSHINCNVDATVCRNSFVLITANCNGTVANVTNGAYGTVTYDEDLNIFTYTQNVETDEVTDTFVYTCNGEDCTVNLEIETGLQENETFLTLEATSNCAVGTPTYTWTIPDCASIADGYTIHSNPIQVIVQEYDPELPMDEQICIFTVDVCCGGNCNGCCKCDTIEWHPPVCVTECGEDPDCICTEPCYEYNPDTGNCEYICAEDQKCCEIEGVLHEAVEETTIVDVEVACIDFEVDGGGSLTDLTIDVTPVVTPIDYDINNITWHISGTRCQVPNNPCLDYRVCGGILDSVTVLNSDVTTGSILGYITEASFVDGHLVVDFDETYVTAAKTKVGSVVLKVAAEVETYCGSAHHSFVITIAKAGFDCAVTIYDTNFARPLCSESIECPEVTGTVNVCQECCDDNDCPTGICKDGVCMCPGDVFPDPITGLCPCPEVLPSCVGCTPALPNYITYPIGENPLSCADNEVFDATTCTCKCAFGYCAHISDLTTCLDCPDCAVAGSDWVIITHNNPFTYEAYVQDCPVCQNCISNVGCVPVSCSPSQFQNPTPEYSWYFNGVRILAGTCCIDNPCYDIDCTTCPSVSECGCLDDVCIPCVTTACTEESDCPVGCDCNAQTGLCNYNPCDAFTCEECPYILTEDCGCDTTYCIPCNTVSCSDNDDCPFGCSCVDNTCNDNPCITYQCDDENDVNTYCPRIDNCGCDTTYCIPCDTVACPIGNECPLGCNCVDGVCEHDTCTFITNECIIEFSQPNSSFTLDINHGLNIVLTPMFEVFGNDNYLTLNSTTVKWEINLSNFLYGFIPVTGIAGITANLNGTLTINTNVFTEQYFLVRCEIIGTGISTTYRYDGLATNEELNLDYSFEQAFGNICYSMLYAPLDNDAEVTSWNFGGETITPIQPSVAQQDAPILFAGSHYLIYTCSEIEPEIEISALVHSSICEDITICSQLIPCPCSGTRTCDNITINTSNVLTSNIWEMSLDIFDENGEQRPWLCEPLSSLQFCGNVVNSYNCNCGGINPYESDQPAVCADDNGLSDWCNNSNNNDNYVGSASPGNCCCGWTFGAGIEILELEGSYLKAQINDYETATLCFQAELDGNTEGNECCTSGCFTPPTPEDCTFTPTIDFSCGQENPGQIMGTLNVTGLDVTITGTPQYSISYTGYNGLTTISNIQDNDIFELEILSGAEYEFTITLMQLGCSVLYTNTTNCDCLPTLEYQFYFCDRLEGPGQIGKPIGIKINNVFTGNGYNWDVNIHSNNGAFPDINTTVPYLGEDYLYITQNGNGVVGIAPQSNAFDCDPGTPYSGAFIIDWYYADVIVTFSLQNSYCNIVTNFNDFCGLITPVIEIMDIEVTCDTNDGTYDIDITFDDNLNNLLGYAEVSGCNGGIITNYSNTGTMTITDCDAIDDIVINIWPIAGCPTTETIELNTLPPCVGCNLDVDASYDCTNEVLNIIVFSGTGPYELSEAVSSPITFNSGHYSVNLPDLVVVADIVTVKVTNENGICIFTKDIDISTCNSIDCGNEPTITYSCTTGFTFTDVNFGGGDTATFYGFPYSVGDIGTPVTNLTVINCEDSNSGLVYIQKGPDCTYLLPIDTRCIEGTIDLTGSTFLDPTTNFVCDTNHIQVILTNGPSSMVLNCAECSNLVNVPVTTGEIDLFCNLVDDNETDLSLIFTSEISDCTLQLDIERNACPDPCNNDPDLEITCQECSQEIRISIDPLPVTPNLHLIGILVDGNPYDILGTYSLGVAFDGGASYLNALDMIYTNTGITLKYEIVDNILIVYSIGDCCLSYNTIELVVCTLSGLSCNDPTLIKLQIANPAASCQMIKTFFNDPNYVCCLCYKAYRTGPVVDVDTDIIYYNCENDIDLNNWTVYVNEGDCIPICKSTGELFFFREVTYTTSCRLSILRHNIANDGSYTYCNVLRSAFIVRVENIGDYTIPSGTEFNLVWSGLGGATNYVAIQNGTINNPLGTKFTTNANIAPGSIFSFGVAHNTIAYPGQTVSVEISTNDINLYFTPLIIELTS